MFVIKFNYLCKVNVTQNLKQTDMKAYTNLNENEILVLKAISIASDANGGDFTYFDEVETKIDGLSKEQIKGYFSQLEKKNYIMIYEGQICPAGEVDFLTDYEF